MKNRRAGIAVKVAHFLTAFTVFTKGLAKLEHPHGYELIIAFLFVSAAYIVAITVFHDRLHEHVKLLDASVYAIECVVMSIVTWLYASEGKHLLQYFTGAAALLFAVALVVRLVRRGSRREAAH
jgi:hypothetical protein